MRITCVHLLLSCLILAACDPASAATAPATRPAILRLKVKPSTHEVEFVRVPGGQVALAPLAEGEKPRTVQVKPFYMARTETTQDVLLIWALALDIPEAEEGPSRFSSRMERLREFEARTGCSSKPYDGMLFGGTRMETGLPAANIPPELAVAYCTWLGKQNSRTVRLPTEAEWQLAAMSGLPTTRSATPGQLADLAWFAANSEESEHAVAQLKPNGFGLYDMLGNVGEWVLLADGEYCLKGGTFRSEARFVDVGARRKENRSWRARDPRDPPTHQMYTDAPFAGFRMVCEE